MCQKIVLPNGDDVSSVAEFEKQFKVKAEDYKHPVYSQIHRDSCLCQVDLDRFFAERSEIEYEYNGDYWISKLTA